MNEGPDPWGPADVTIVVRRPRTDEALFRGEFRIVGKEFRDGELICLTADDGQGRRALVCIRAVTLEEVPAPAGEPEPRSPLRIPRIPMGRAR